MKQSILVVALASGLAAPALADSGALAGKALRQAVVGKTVHLNISGFNLPIAYRSDGTMHGRVRAFVAALAGGEPQRDVGKWWVKGDQLCQRWRTWMDGNTYCYKLNRRGGNAVTWRRNDGRTGTARIGG